MSDPDRARQYRFRAEELRVICASWLEEDAHQMLERVAADYDRMAALLDQRGQDHPAVFGPCVYTRQ